VVETTRTGDISQRGQHAKPIAAQSRAFGGFSVNRLIAEHLLKRRIESKADEEQITGCLKNYERCKSGDLDISELNIRNQTFLRWYERFLGEVESIKIELSRSVRDWHLGATVSEKYALEMPDDPFNDVARYVTEWFTANEMREIFVDSVWAKNLKKTISGALRIANQEIGNDRVQVVLLSGGSSNFRWLEELLQRDYSDELSDAGIVSLQDSYQEVVAKGLAIECARRGYVEDSEFSDVTYNPVFLVLDPDGKGEERKRFKLIESSIKVAPPDQVAELLSSAAQVDAGETVFRWKTKLDHPPKQRLRYYFLKDPSDTLDLESRYNIMECEVPTSRGTSFESQLKVELQLRADGTTVPKFIYKTGKKNRIIHSANGLPFYLDLVSSDGSPRKSAFLGIDFGTSTSAVSYVDWNHVQLIQMRQSSRQWCKLHELLDLPYPASSSIQRLLAESSGEQVLTSLDAAESVMAFMIFVMWAEISSQRKDRKLRLLGGQYKRSAGQLKALLIQLKKSKSQPGIGKRLRDLLKEIPDDDLDDLVNQLNREKHKKQEPGSFDPLPLITALANVLSIGVSQFRFGYFENVRREGFGGKHRGVFRVAHGAQPFHERYDYEGKHSFSDQEAFLVSPEEGVAISLTPAMFWEHASRAGSSASRCFIYDGVSGEKKHEYKEIDGFNNRIVTDGGLLELVCDVVENGAGAKRYEGLRFASGESFLHR
jgi:hypothetical protein